MTEKLDEVELNAIEARANAAAPGPWRSTTDCISDRIVVDAGGRAILREEGIGTSADIVFAAAAREDIPRLIAYIEELEEEVKDLIVENEVLKEERDDCYAAVERYVP